jgi:predicted HD superfamily hydrolase involved in NAD metabolism
LGKPKQGLMIDRYLTFLEGVLTPSRLRHSLGVEQVIGELAGIYGLDREKALAVGLLHDAAKDLEPERVEKLVAEGAIVIQHECDRDYAHYLHAPVGAWFVRQELGVDDPLILDTIARHTFYGEGVACDENLLWCLRFADILEPNRGWHKEPGLVAGMARLRERVYAGNQTEAAWLLTGWPVRWYAATGVPIHPNMKQAYKELSEQLKLVADPSPESNGFELR